MRTATGVELHAKVGGACARLHGAALSGPWIVLAVMVVLVGMLSASAAPLQSQVAFDREVIELVPGGMSRAYSEFTVRNTGAGEMEATVRLEDWDVDAGGRSHWRASGRVAGSCKGRVTVSPENIRLGPGEQRTLRITVREGARFDAECWTAAVVQPTRFAARPFSVEPTVMTRGSLPLYVTPPELDVAGAVSALIVRRDSIDVLFENTGRSRADIVGVVQVRTHDNTVVHSMPLPEATVLPGGLRRYRIPVPALPPGRFTVIGIVDFGGDVMAAAQAALEITRTNTQSTTRTGTR